MINIAIQIRPLLGGADCAGMVALNHRNNQLYTHLRCEISKYKPIFAKFEYFCYGSNSNYSIL